MSVSRFVATVVYAWPLTRRADAPHAFALDPDPRPVVEGVERDRKPLEALATALGAMVHGYSVPSELHITFDDVHAASGSGSSFAALFTHHLRVAGPSWHGPRDWAVRLRVDKDEVPSLSLVRLAVNVLQHGSGRAEMAVLEVNGVPQCVIPAPAFAEAED